MQGIDATFDGIPVERGRDSRQVLLKIFPSAAALALAGSVGFFVLHMRPAVTPDVAKVPSAAPAQEIASNPFGDLIVDPSFVAEMKPAAEQEKLASLKPVPPAPAEIPLPSLEAPSSPSATTAPLETIPLPPKRDVPEIADSAPLPPPRPSDFGPLPTLERPTAQQSAGITRPAAQADNRNFFQKLFGFGQPSGLGQPARPAVAAKAPESRVASIAPETHAPFTAPQGRIPGMAIFSGGSNPTAGYDGYTAVYDISARTVYLPDGTRLEAHSGLGDRLDDPRYVSERARGATPPHLYELTMREDSFHGVQALRLNPVGDGDLFGRAGLLAHPYMLGPNGDSNGCVSIKDYEAFLRAYQNGRVRKLVVVSRL